VGTLALGKNQKALTWGGGAKKKIRRRGKERLTWERYRAAEKKSGGELRKRKRDSRDGGMAALSWKMGKRFFYN